MSEFVKRNLPVFLIGGVTLLLFVFIIVAAQKNPPATPELIEVDSTELLAPHTYVKGLYDAPISIVEFSDFGCPACKAQHPIVESIIEDYPTLVSWGYRHFPLPQHKNAEKAAAAAQAAGEQGKFWEYADVLFANQGAFEEDELVSYAQEEGLDVEKFKEDIKNNAFADIVTQDISYGKQLGVNSTPTFFINGKQVVLRSTNDLRLQVEAAIKSLGLEDQAKSPEILQKEQEQKNMEKLDQTFGTLEINYTAEGFVPSDAQAFFGQLVKWTNQTQQDITFVQLSEKFAELSKPFQIKPGESFEFRLNGSGLFTYKNESDVNRASILIQKPVTEL